MYGVYVGVLGGGTQQAVRGLVGGERWNWVEFVAYTLTMVVVLPPAVRLSRWAVDSGRFGQNHARRDRDQRSRLVAEAIEAGAIPPDGSAAAWQRALRDDIRETNGLRWGIVSVTALGAVLIGAAAVVANDNAPAVWAVVLALTAQSLAVVLPSGRRLRVARQLVRELGPV